MKFQAEITLPRAQLEALTDEDLRWLEAEVSRRFEEELRRRLSASYIFPASHLPSQAAVRQPNICGGISA